MTDSFAINRREALRAGGFLALGFMLSGVPLARAATDPKLLRGSLRENPRLDAWIRINADGTVMLRVGKVELGQGILTAVGQICADELDVNLERVGIVSGDTAVVPNEGVTAGSFSMPNCGTAVQYAAAEVRHILLALAAEKLGTPAEGLTVEDGTIRAPSGRSVSYWELVTDQTLAREATGTVKPKSPDRYRYIGQAVPRRDLPAKFTGKRIFVHDHRPDGMVHGRVVRPPTYGSRLLRVDAAAVEALPGVVKVVRDGSFLGVVAGTERQTDAAAEALAKAAQWESKDELPGTDGIFDWLTSRKAQDIEIKNQARSGGGEPVRVIEATYLRPYHMHASIGPSLAVATFADGALTIQTHSQSVFETGRAIAEMLGLEPARVRCQHMDGSGCYGHNGADDVAADAALLARAVPGGPVRVQWSR